MFIEGIWDSIQVIVKVFAFVWDGESMNNYYIFLISNYISWNLKKERSRIAKWIEYATDQRLLFNQVRAKFFI